MASWHDAPYLHFPNSTYLDSLSNNTDPYTIYYGQKAVVSEKQVLVYGIINILGIVFLGLSVATILLSGTRVSNKVSQIKIKRLSLTTTTTKSSTTTTNTRNSIIRRKTTTPIHRIQRDPCLIDSFIVIILVSMLNLLYWSASGGRIDTEEILYLPHARLCRAQAILQAGSQAAQVSVVLSVVLRLWLKTITLTRPYFDKFRGRFTLFFLLVLPYLFVIGFMPSMTILTSNAKNPILIPTPFYCSLLDLHIRRSYQILTGVIAILTLIMELWVIFLILQHFHQTSRTTNLANSSHGLNFKPTIIRLLNTRFSVRVSLLVFWTMGMIATSLYQAFDKTITDPTSDFFFASMGLVGFICFASQLPRFNRHRHRKGDLPPITIGDGIHHQNPMRSHTQHVKKLDLGDFLGEIQLDSELVTTSGEGGPSGSGISPEQSGQTFELEEKEDLRHVDKVNDDTFPSSGMIITLHGSVQVDQEQSIAGRSDAGELV
ncbi:hypothetical protein L486_03191 [Kwoniella mangroviensis CBS 10435]|uniref:Uncharacterized protein n=1 Tax=Kwoniella mangroviensis CBS 10435 TaxID=1331196 RepID=A0A1B9IT37_9TREE|nr:hypothetical protein L486_03191 [Kwoniella mangroviensis CBS 10435]